MPLNQSPAQLLMEKIVTITLLLILGGAFVYFTFFPNLGVQTLATIYRFNPKSSPEKIMEITKKNLLTVSTGDNPQNHPVVGILCFKLKNESGPALLKELQESDDLLALQIGRDLKNRFTFHGTQIRWKEENSFCINSAFPLADIRRELKRYLLPPSPAKK